MLDVPLIDPALHVQIHKRITGHGTTRTTEGDRAFQMLALAYCNDCGWRIDFDTQLTCIGLKQTPEEFEEEARAINAAYEEKMAGAVSEAIASIAQAAREVMPPQRPGRAPLAETRASGPGADRPGSR